MTEDSAKATEVRKKKKKRFLLLSCFSGGELGGEEAALGSRGPWFRNKSKTVPVDDQGESEKPAMEDEIPTRKRLLRRFWKAKGNRKNKTEEDISNASSAKDKLSEPNIRHITAKYDTRLDPTPLIRVRDLAQTGTATSHPGSPGLKHFSTQSASGLGTSKLDSWAGISVIATVLILFMFLDRIPAIVCLSTWFYVLARARGAKSTEFDGKKGSYEMDVNSKEYKKKVVLGGFLRRRRRKNTSTL